MLQLGAAELEELTVGQPPAPTFLPAAVSIQPAPTALAPAGAGPAATPPFAQAAADNQQAPQAQVHRLPTQPQANNKPHAPASGTSSSQQPAPLPPASARNQPVPPAGVRTPAATQLLVSAGASAQPPTAPQGKNIVFTM